MSEEATVLVLAYLDKVSLAAQGRMKPMQRTELIEQVRGRIERDLERRGASSSSAVRDVLGRLGPPGRHVEVYLAVRAEAAGLPEVRGDLLHGAARVVDQPVTARKERLRQRTVDLDPRAVAAIVLVALVLLVLWLGWFGFFLGWAVGWVFPQTSRGVRIVALVWLPVALIVPLFVIGVFTDLSTTLHFWYPVLAGVAGGGFLLWGSQYR